MWRNRWHLMCQVLLKEVWGENVKHLLCKAVECEVFLCLLHQDMTYPWANPPSCIILVILQLLSDLQLHSMEPIQTTPSRPCFNDLWQFRQGVPWLRVWSPVHLWWASVTPRCSCVGRAHWTSSATWWWVHTMQARGPHESKAYKRSKNLSQIYIV